jgi:tRNA-2-methylthio-N6-dimethylallyladenosine synthase
LVARPADAGAKRAAPNHDPIARSSRRLQLLNAQQQQWQRRRNDALVGRRDSVLIETRDADGRISGRTPHFRIVHLDGPEGLIGHVVPVEIVAAAPNSFQGRLSQPLH